MDGPDLRSQSLPELISSLTGQISRLVRAELALARAELLASGRQAALGGGLLTGAAVVGFTAWLVMVAAAIAGIAEGLPVWASALIIGAALVVLAGVLALIGRARLTRGMRPLPMTTDTVRKDVHELTSRPGSNGSRAPVPGQAVQAAVPGQATRAPVPGQTAQPPVPEQARAAVPRQRPAPSELPPHQPAPPQQVPR
jgi:hypothetical protein